YETVYFSADGILRLFPTRRSSDLQRVSGQVTTTDKGWGGKTRRKKGVGCRSLTNVPGEGRGKHRPHAVGGWGAYPLKDALTASGERIFSATMAAQPRTPASSHRALGTT